MQVKEKEIFAKGRDGNKISILYYESMNKNAPLLIDIHGGGFVGGHHFDDRELCLHFYSELGINVASIEYRYAPEVFFPKATYDCFDAFK